MGSHIIDLKPVPVLKTRFGQTPPGSPRSKGLGFTDDYTASTAASLASTAAGICLILCGP